jgi:hypothetical protein
MQHRARNDFKLVSHPKIDEMLALNQYSQMRLAARPQPIRSITSWQTDTV